LIGDASNDVWMTDAQAREEVMLGNDELALYVEGINAVTAKSINS
jgi:hypothetical protein